MKKRWFLLLVVALFVVSCNVVQQGEINLDSYSKIRTGMTFAEVKKIMGKPTRVIKEVKVGGVSAGTYAWDTRDGSLSFVIGVENGRVKIKMPPQSMKYR